jgi:hypothetical protein
MEADVALILLLGKSFPLGKKTKDQRKVPLLWRTFRWVFYTRGVCRRPRHLYRSVQTDRQTAVYLPRNPRHTPLHRCYSYIATFLLYLCAARIIVIIIESTTSGVNPLLGVHRLYLYHINGHLFHIDGIALKRPRCEEIT